MDLAHAYRAKTKFKTEGFRDLNTQSVLIIKLPVMSILARLLFLVMVVIAVPFILSIARDCENGVYGFESLPLVYEDLVEEGLLKRGEKGLVVAPSVGDFADFEIFSENGVEFAVESDFERKRLTDNEMFDFVFANGFGDESGFVDRVVKIGGIVVLRLGSDKLDELEKRANYKIVYVRRYDSTFVALKKIDLGIHRRLLGFTSDAKNGALSSLEDVFLEPPRKKMAKLRKIRFLPDLLGDSLESYHRRIFITDEKKNAVKWFGDNYPTKNKDFEIYNLEIETYDSRMLTEMSSPPFIEVSDWLVKNVREEDYVVMKAEAQVVEELMKGRTINLVDELFLECKNQWEDDISFRGNKIKRAYWQCLALYGRLRDEGIAVHQWWN